MSWKNIKKCNSIQPSVKKIFSKNMPEIFKSTCVLIFVIHSGRVKCQQNLPKILSFTNKKHTNLQIIWLLKTYPVIFLTLLWSFIINFGMSILQFTSKNRIYHFYSWIEPSILFLLKKNTKKNDYFFEGKIKIIVNLNENDTYIGLDWGLLTSLYDFITLFCYLILSFIKYICNFHIYVNTLLQSEFPNFWCRNNCFLCIFPWVNRNVCSAGIKQWLYISHHLKQNTLCL